MKGRGEHFQGTRGRQLYCETWLPERPARGALAIVHGMGEHGGRYKHLVEYLAACGYASTALDLRGHGRSSGRRGHVDSWADYLGDLDAFLKHIREQQPGTPLFLYGHSLGSLIVLDYALRDPDHARALKGIILSGFAIQPVEVAKPAAIVSAKVMSRIWPTLVMRSADLSTRLSRDPAVAAAYRQDPLVSDRFTVRWGAESLKAVDSLKKRPARLDVPVLFIHGEADAIASLAGARAYFEALASPDKSMRVFPEGLHEQHNDISREQATRDIAEWMDTHLVHSP